MRYWKRVWFPLLRGVPKITQGSAYWIGLLPLLLVTLTSYFNTTALVESTRQQMRFRDALSALQQVFSLVRDAETSQRGYLLTQKDEYLGPYRLALASAEEKFDHLERLAAVAGQEDDIRKFIELLRRKLDELTRTVDAAMSPDGFTAAIEMVQSGRGKEYLDQARELHAKLEAAIYAQLNAIDQRIRTLSLWTSVGAVLGNVCAAVLFAYVLFRLHGELGRRRLIEEQARELAVNARLFQSAAEASPTALLVTDSTGRIRLINRQVENLFGYASQELLGQMVEMLLPERYRASHPQKRDSFFEKPTSRTLGESRELYGLRKEGTEFPLEIGLNPLATEEGLFVVSAIVDISERKLSEQRIQNLNDELELRVQKRTAQLESANKELESFTYTVSHDLRAPLRAIDGFSRLVVEEFGKALPDEGKEFLQRVRKNATQMGQLIDDLLAFARLGRRSVLKHPVDTESIVRACLAELSKELEGRQVEISIGCLPCCAADPSLLKQVWTNLISNALKYTRKRDVAHIEIGCHTELRPSLNDDGTTAESRLETVYFVKDDGAGFDMKYAHKLFDVFQRLHRETEYEGTGVGLAIVQRIIERHGGHVWGEALPNQGATFSFTLA
jgi:PAS domain S-box-containing protein